MALQVLLDGGVGGFGVFGMVSGVAVVKVEKVLAMAAIGIVPLQLNQKKIWNHFIQIERKVYSFKYFVLDKLGLLEIKLELIEHVYFLMCYVYEIDTDRYREQKKKAWGD